MPRSVMQSMTDSSQIARFTGLGRDSGNRPGIHAGLRRRTDDKCQPRERGFSMTRLQPSENGSSPAARSPVNGAKISWELTREPAVNGGPKTAYADKPRERG